jgi:hypothetical protein
MRSQEAASAQPSSTAGIVTAAERRALAARYLAIAHPANRSARSRCARAGYLSVATLICVRAAADGMAWICSYVSGVVVRHCGQVILPPGDG